MADEGSDTPSSGDATAAPRGKTKTTRTPKVVPLPQKRELSPEDLALCHASGLTAETIELAELYTETNPRALSAIVDRPYPRACGPALVFPFTEPGAPSPNANRIRPRHPRVDKRRGKTRVVKYDQATSAGLLVYYPPRTRVSGALRDVTQRLLWTEGERKALALEQLGYPTIGLTGVWNWTDPDARAADGRDQLHPSIRKHVTVAGREHLIVYDGDSRDNAQVMHAAARLAGVLYAAGATKVWFVCPPPGDQKGIDDYYAAHGGDAVTALLGTAEPLTPVDPRAPRQRIRSVKVLADAPVHAEAVIPDGYSIQDSGRVMKLATSEKGHDQEVSSSPLFVTRRLRDASSGNYHAEVCFRRNGRWEQHVVDRIAIADSRALVHALAPHDAPVTSTSAGRLVEWCDAYLESNAECIEVIPSFARVGWHELDGQEVFVLNEPITRDGHEVRAVVDDRGMYGELFASLRPRGTLEGHIEALNRAWHADPVCAAMICSALAVPLLKPLGAPNVALHLIGESSRGKTTMLKIGGSIYGDPSDPRWVAAWNATAVGAELRAAALSDLPQCYDELGGGDPEQLTRLVYGLINGTGRTRGQRDITLRTAQRWRTILLSTGEQSLVEEDAATGAQVRVMEFRVDGIGELTAAQTDALREDCAAHSGSFGRAWIEAVVNIENWSNWRERLAVRTKHYRELSEADPVQKRIAGHYALLDVTAQMALQVGLGNGAQRIEKLFLTPRVRTQVVGLADRSRDLVEDWVLSEPDAFPELILSTAGEVHTPAPVRPGMRVCGYRTEGELRFIPAELRRFLQKHRLSAREVVRQWESRGWTRLERNRLDTRYRINGRQTRLIPLIEASAMEASI